MIKMSLKESAEDKNITLIDILDVILDKGVAIKADLIISIAGIDLVYLDLKVLIASVEKLVQAQEGNQQVLSSENFEREREVLDRATSKPGTGKDQLRP
jgi:gas vesicle structural protein